MILEPYDMVLRISRWEILLKGKFDFGWCAMGCRHCVDSLRRGQTHLQNKYRLLGLPEDWCMHRLPLLFLPGQFISNFQGGGGAESLHARVMSVDSVMSTDTLAEWLRRRPAKPMGSPRVGSNPTGVDWLAAELMCGRLSS